jgi:protein gp138/GpV-like protein with Apex motif
MSQTTTAGPFGYQQPGDDGSAFAAYRFFAKSLIAQIATAKWVKIVSVTTSGAAAPIGTVTVQPLVNQTDSQGNATPHGQLSSLQYLRIAGGANAVIMDPAAGDIGMAVFADRDSSKVINTGAQANPGSFRKHDMADGFYLGMGWSGSAPTQSIAFASGGITITSPGTVTINAEAIALTSATLTHNGVNVGSTHKHGGVMSGGGETGVPNE